MFAARSNSSLNLVRSGIDHGQFLLAVSGSRNFDGNRTGWLVGGRVDFRILAGIDGFVLDVQFQGSDRLMVGIEEVEGQYQLFDTPLTRVMDYAVDIDVGPVQSDITSLSSTLAGLGFSLAAESDNTHSIRARDPQRQPRIPLRYPKSRPLGTAIENLDRAQFI